MQDEELMSSVINECGYIKDADNYEISTINYLFDQQIKCKLISKKCDKNIYYIHTYDPSTIVENSLFISSGQFNLTKKEQCCNCISITLYANYENDDLVKYMSSIVRSAQNMIISLPTWILRLYMDISIYDYIQNYENDEIGDYLRKQLMFLHKSANVEIYTNLCPEPNKINRLRIYRFSALYDEDVNVRMIREADGIVSFQDCHNIKIFLKSNKFMYIIPYNNVYESLISKKTMDKEKFSKYSRTITAPENKETNLFFRNSYSIWLGLYKEYIEKDYFDKNWNAYEILAGIFGTKLQLNRIFFLNKINHVQKLIDNYIENKGQINMSNISTKRK